MVLRSELEKDVNNIIRDLQTTDYRIPSISDIALLSMKKLAPFYFFIFISGLFTWGFHGPHELLIAAVVFLYSIAGAAIITLLVVVLLYYPNFMFMCLSDKVKSRSFLCLKLERLIKLNVRFVHIISIIISLPFVIFISTGFLIPFISYFVMILIASIAIRVSMGGYFTSEIINTLGNFRRKINHPSVKL